MSERSVPAAWYWGLNYQVRRERDGFWRVYCWQSGGGWQVAGPPVTDVGQRVEDVACAFLAARRGVQG